MRSIICYATGGLGNRVFPLASCMEYAKATNRKLYLHWPRDRRCDGDFGSLFAEDIEVVDTEFLYSLNNTETRYYIRFQASADNDLNIYGRPFLSSKPSPIRKIGQDPNAHTTPNLLVCDNTFLSEVPIEKSQECARNLKIRPEIWDFIQEESQQLNLSKSIVGMHLRGTDFPTPHGWIGWLKEQVETYNRKVFVCSDDRGMEQQAKNSYPDHVIIRDNKVFVEKEDPSRGWANNVYTSTESLVDSIKDLYLLSKTNLLYFNKASTFAQYAKILG